MGYFGIPFRNGVPIGLGSVASFGAQQFDPSSLFIGGTAGTWYDPSDPTTLFTTSTGTTPCAVPGSGSQVLVGLMLDKSQGAPGALGAELVTNGTFDANINGWTAQFTSTASWDNGTLKSVSSGTNAGEASAPITCVVGRLYLATATIIPGTTSGRISASNLTYGAAAGGTAYTNVAGTVSFYFVANATTMYIVAGVASGVNGQFANFDNISVREIPGNHAIAFNDTTARPELSARVNLLTYSEQFDNGVWSAIGAKNVTTNTHIAPDGTLTADTLTDNSNVAFQGIGQGVTVPVNTATYVATMYVRKTSGGTSATFGVNLGITGGTSVSVTPRLNTDTGVVISGSGTAVSAGDYWLFTCSVANNGTAGNVNLSMAIYPATSSHNVSGDSAAATGSAVIWGADLRPANIGSAIPSYQRIADQYTYDSNGFPSYLRFDGVDDSMYTPASINFSGTDKMSVFAGVRKLSDAAGAILAELSASAGANNGAFYIAAPTAALPDFGFLSRGTAAQLVTASPYAAPVTVVATGIGDIAGAVSAIRVNGSQVGINTTSQGTGNYGTYPLYIGSRNNTSARFNGHLYSLIIAGTQLQSGSITATEQYVAGKTGVQI